jgi:hypothetical protein
MDITGSSETSESFLPGYTTLHAGTSNLKWHKMVLPGIFSLSPIRRKQTEEADETAFVTSQCAGALLINYLRRVIKTRLTKWAKRATHVRIMHNNINKLKSNEMHLDCLLYHLILPTCFGRCRPKHVGRIKWYNKHSTCISLDFCLFIFENARSNTLYAQQYFGLEPDKKIQLCTI